MGLCFESGDEPDGWQSRLQPSEPRTTPTRSAIPEVPPPEGGTPSALVFPSGSCQSGDVKKNADMMDPKVLMAYDRWVVKHLDEMVRKHPGKVIAVYQDRLVAVADTHKEALAAAERLNPLEPPLTMQVPGIEDLEAIL